MDNPADAADGPIFGASSPERIAESLRAANLKLSAEELTELSAG